MKIRNKKGYNVIIKDLGITLRAEKREWIQISDDDYNNSLDIKSLAKFLEIEKDTKKTSDEVVVDVTPSRNTAFMKEGRVYENPKDVFVRCEKEDEVVLSDEKDNNENVEATEIVETSEVIEEATPASVVKEELPVTETKVESKSDSQVKSNNNSKKGNKKSNKKDLSNKAIEAADKNGKNAQK